MADLKAASVGQSQSAMEKDKAMKRIWINLCIGAVAFHLSPLLIDLAVAQEVEQVPTRFSDVPETHWAAPFIQALATQNIIGGFPDGTFHPNEPVSRAQFAALLNQAFDPAAVRASLTFQDVPNSHWAALAIRQAYTGGFISGYPGDRFNPDQSISRSQVLVSLANGLGYAPQGFVDLTLQYYQDVAQIPDYARSSISAATEQQLVVNYPNTTRLNPNRSATRAEVAAFIYQALYSQDQTPVIPSPYIVCTDVMVDSYKQQLTAGEASAIESLIACEEMDSLIAAGSSALPALKLAIQDSSNVVQASSIFALGQIVTSDLSLASESVPLLTVILEDAAEDMAVRSVAAEALGQIGQRLLMTNEEGQDDELYQFSLETFAALEGVMNGEIALSSPNGCNSACIEETLSSPLFLSTAGALEEIAGKDYVYESLGAQSYTGDTIPTPSGSELAEATNRILTRNPPIACRFIRSRWIWFCP
jgi:hypothetical protein